MEQPTVIIGAGSMGSAIGLGLLKSNLRKAEDILFIDLDQDKLNSLRDKHGFKTSLSLDSLKNLIIKDLIIAVKPKDINFLLENLKSFIHDKNTLIVSIAAGIKIATYERIFSENPIFRVMPNTPCQISKGISVISFNSRVQEKDLEEIKNVFRSLGSSLVMEESQLDAVTAVSGSGPAYFFLMVEALTEAAIKLGIKPEEAQLLAEHTAYGASSLLIQSKEDASTLRERVTSPKGTTAAAIEILEKRGFSKIIFEAVKSAKDKSIEMSLEE
jgi:pyrroline-5-carboxylate reductase